MRLEVVRCLQRVYLYALLIYVLLVSISIYLDLVWVVLKRIAFVSIDS